MPLAQMDRGAPTAVGALPWPRCPMASERMGVCYALRAADRIIALRAGDGRGAAVMIPGATEAADLGSDVA